MTRVLSLNRKELCLKTSFSLAVFTKTPKIEFAEREAHTTGEANASAKNEGLVPQYVMC